jgi:hypothetical protein
MSFERPAGPGADVERNAPVSSAAATPPPSPDGRSSLASLLDITDEDLAPPLAVPDEITDPVVVERHVSSAPPAPVFVFDDVAEESIFADVRLDTTFAGERGGFHEEPGTGLLSGQVSDAPLGLPAEPAQAPDDVWSIPAEVIASAIATSNLPARLPGSTPVRPPAIAIPPNSKKHRTSEPPVANFGAADIEAGAVLWPQQRSTRTPTAAREVCARCGSGFLEGKCDSCGYTVSIAARVSRRGRWQTVISAFIDSDSRLLRTLGALLLSPGELTAAYVAGDKRRYARPMVIGVMALIVFGLIGAVGGLRPRPDRALVIGADRTQEVVAGLADPNSGYSDDGPRTVSNTVLSSLEALPVLFLPAMGFTVFAIIGTARSFSKRETPWAAAFATHFGAWFVVWWGVAVPVMLLVLKFGFEYHAAMSGVTKVRYDIDQLEGVSAWWNLARAIVTSRAFHSSLLLIGLLPWACKAYRAAFGGPWWRAVLLGSIIAIVPLFMLIPFV